MLTPEQISAYLDGEMNEAQVAEFEASLQGDPQTAQAAFDQLRMDQALQTLLAKPDENERVKQSVMAVILGKRLADLKAGVMDTARMGRENEDEEENEIEDEPPKKFIPLPSAKVTAWVAFAAAACVVIGLGLNWVFGDTITLASATAGVQVTRGGKPVALEAGARLDKDDVISTEARGLASLRYSDGTRLELAPGTSVTITDKPARPKQITVNNGVLAVNAAKQPEGRPMTLRTPHAEITVVGTEFHLDVQSTSTRLEVDEGKVRVNNGASTADVAANQFVEATKAPLKVEETARDPLQWPFTPQSPWNQSIGSQAAFAPVDSTAFKFTGTLNECFIVCPLYRTSRADPVREFRGNVAPQRLPFPDGITLPKPTELVSIAIAPEGMRSVAEFRQVQRLPSGVIQARFQASVDLWSTGVLPDSNGVADFGGSALAGALRQGELTRGIRHALAMAIPAKLLNRNGPNAQPFVWPASRATILWRNAYGNSGNLFLGSLLAIPPEVDLTKVGVGTGGPGYELARAMQDYGIYITDASELTPKLFTVDETLPPNMDQLVSKLLPHLQVITNNSASSAGGGGTPRRPPAPPLMR